MTLERVVLTLIQHGRARCGIGFGKYPLGVKHAIEQLLPLLHPDERKNVETSWQDFLARLER